MSLFAGDAGFRLSYFELYNWGTFNGVWRMSPNEQNSVLFGAKGAGKTTVVDALVTLLVPPRQISYNQASETKDKTKGRSLVSYFLGHYGQIQEEGKSNASIQKIRDENNYTVLLGSFKNPKEDKTVTLVQFRFYHNEEIKTIYIVSGRELDIEKHFKLNTNNRKEFKHLKDYFSKLLGNSTFIFDKYSEYSKSFCHHLGIQSDKALSLFNKLVGLKEVENLNTFIREQILDETDIKERLEAMKKSYKGFLEIERKIEEQQNQLEALTIIETKGKEYKEYNQTIKTKQSYLDMLEYFCAEIKMQLIKDEVEIQSKALTEAENGKNIENEKIKSLEERIFKLTIAIRENKTQQAIEKLNTDIKLLDAEIKPLEDTFKKYENASKLVKLEHLPVNQKEFDEYLGIYTKKHKDLNIENEILKQTIIDEAAHLQNETKDYEAQINQIKAYQKQETHIRPELAKRREEIAAYLGIDKQDLPFAGELMQLKAEHKEWEGAIERLLGAFATTLLVPKQYELAVNKYMNANHLRANFNVQVVVGNESFIYRLPKQNGVFNKIEIKPNPYFYNYLAGRLKEKHDYECFETDSEVFKNTAYSITKKGYIQHAPQTYNKNDKYDINDKTKYNLGFSNYDKIAELRRQAQAKKEQNDILGNNLKKKQTTQGENENNLKAMNNFIQFSDFNAIDANPKILEKQKRLDEKAKLEKSDDLKAIEEMKAQLETAEIDKANASKSRDAFLTNKTSANTKIENLGKENSTCIETMATHQSKFNQTAILGLKAEYWNEKTVLEKIDSQKASIEKKIQKEKDRSSDTKSSLKEELERTLMHEFLTKHSYPDLKNTIDYIDDFISLKKRIQNKELDKYKGDYDNILKEGLVKEISSMRGQLEDVFLKDIKDEIKKINEPLAQIKYSDQTYIEIKHKPINDEQINSFKSQIKDILAGSLGGNTKINLPAIKSFMQALENENWRKKVTDVRTWLDFFIDEKNIDTHETVRTYLDSSGASGGQKTQLAYTCLAAGFMLRSGAKDGNNKSFNFAIIDEAFSKLDDETPGLIMQLFKQLNLQLIVIIPDRDKINHICNYIKSIHVVENTPKRNDSKMYDILITQQDILSNE